MILAEYWSRFQSSLFPFLVHAIEEPLTAKLEQLVRIWDVVEIERHVLDPFGSRLGRPCYDRRPVARAFVAKAVYDLTTTEALVELLKTHRALRRLCGFEGVKSVPSSTTFSRAFARFAEQGLGDIVHRALVSEYVSDQVVMHVSRDSTAISARERVFRTPKKVKEKRKRGRPKKGEERPSPEIKRLDAQLTQSAQDALRELPQNCNWGTKQDTGGHKHTWKGYKVHTDWADNTIPITVVTTSASVHDSQVAIPMARMTADRITCLYELMDSAYDTPQIRQVIEEVGHVAIIDPHPRRNGVPTEKLFDPATTERYKKRTTAERGYSRCKDEFGFRHIRVRGNSKVHMHIMFGMIALFADQILKPYKG